MDSWLIFFEFCVKLQLFKQDTNTFYQTLIIQFLKSKSIIKSGES